MGRETLEEILYRSKTGRMVFPEVIGKIARDIMETKFSDLVNDEMIQMCRESSGTDYTDLVVVAVCNDRTYERFVYMIRRQLVLGGILDCFDLIMLSCMKYGGFAQNRLKEWYQLSVEDVMKAANLCVEYEKWFARDAVLFEKNFGRVPSVADVFKTFNDRHFKQLNNSIYVDPRNESFKSFIPKSISDPFCRSRCELGLPENMSGKYPEYNKLLTRLICVWTWYLLVEAPHRICGNSCD